MPTAFELVSQRVDARLVDDDLVRWGRGLAAEPSVGEKQQGAQCQEVNQRLGQESFQHRSPVMEMEKCMVTKKGARENTDAFFNVAN